MFYNAPLYVRILYPILTVTMFLLFAIIVLAGFSAIFYSIAWILGL